MNDFIIEVLMNYTGEEAISHLISLCNATEGFLDPEDVNVFCLDEGDAEREFIWAIQRKFEVEYQLLDCLVGEERLKTNMLKTLMISTSNLMLTLKALGLMKKCFLKYSEKTYLKITRIPSTSS